MNDIHSFSLRGPTPDHHWLTALPSHLVHRRANAEVLVASIAAIGRDRFLAAAQWPLSHPTRLRSGADGRHSPLLVAETLRQAALVIATAYYGAPQDAHFLIGTLTMSLDPGAEPRPRFGATDLMCEVQVRDIVLARDQVRSLAMSAAYSHGGRTFASAEGTARIMPGAVYRRLRGLGPTGDAAVDTDTDTEAPQGLRPEGRPLEPFAVGVERPGDVMIAEVDGDDEFRLHCAESNHPYFFDHPSDHVTAMVLLEAARQAAQVHLGRGEPLRPTTCQISAEAFTEWSPTPRLRCRTEGAGVAVTVLQAGRKTAGIALEV